VRGGDMAALRAVLDASAARPAEAASLVNGAEPDGTTPLLWAVRRNDRAMTDALLAAGADVRRANRYGVAPLNAACTAGYADLALRLLDAGADPNGATPEGETPLMAAARSGALPVVKALLARGVDPNAAEGWRGQTALMWAAAEGHTEVVRTLLSGGAAVGSRSTAGFTPLLFAVRGGHESAVRTLLASGADANDTTRDGTAAVMLATINGRFSTAALLLEHGASPNAPDVRGSALHAIAWLRTPGWPLGLPPLIVTDPMDSLELARRLLKHGANPNVRVAWKEQKRGGFDLGMVVNNPPNISVGRNYLSLVGATPYYLAAKHSDVELMRLLADHGADVSIPTAQGVTPLMAAAGVGFWQGESPGPNNGVPEHRTLEAVKLAWELSRGADINATAHFHQVRIEGDGVELLHRLPLNVHEFDETKPGDMRWEGVAAIHGAAVRGINAVIQFLVEKGADLTMRTKLGWTPLMLTEGMYIGQTEKEVPEAAAFIRRLLQERGIDPESLAARRQQ
ncbi:MAG: ankyrin repeat domain-containing protein, partial [Vicinamibacterales bacterium]